MSVLFPKVNKMPSWDWRPIYYDPKKDEMDRKLKALQAERAAKEKAAQENAADGTAAQGKSTTPGYTPSLHRGSFRESHEDHMSMRQKANRQSRLVLWITILALLIFVFYYLL